MRQSVQKFGMLFLVVALGGCASMGGSSGGGETELRAGVIEQLKPTTMESNHHVGVGAIVGGIAGVGLGSLVGGGTGRDVAMVAGAVGGAVAGNYVQKKKFDKPEPAQQVVVRLTSGVLVSIVQPINNALAPGMAIFVQGSGAKARVVPAN